MRLKFCAACGETKDLQSHHLVTRREGGTNSERNLLTLCHPCHAKLHRRQLNGIYSASEQTKAGLAPRVLSGKSLRKLTLETEKAIYAAHSDGVSSVQLAETARKPHPRDFRHGITRPE